MVLVVDADVDNEDVLDPNTLDFSDGNLAQINKDSLNIVSCNINSILAENRLDELKVLIKEASIDILFLSETKLDDNISVDRFKIEGFNLEQNNRDRRGGGTMFYIKNNLSYKRNKNIEYKGFGHMCLDLICDKKRYSINGLYRPPENDQSSKDLFLVAMRTILTKLNGRSTYTNMICGDLNFGNIYNFNGGLREKPLDNEGADLFLEYGYSQLIDIPTRYCNLSTSLIDLFFINKTDNVILNAVLPSIADHLGTLISINCKNFTPKQKIINKYYYNDSNWHELKKLLIDLDDPNLYDTENKDINEITSAFTEKLILGREKFVPTKTVKIKPFDQPWFTTESRKLLNKRNKKYKEYKNLTKTAWSVEKLQNVHNSYKAASREFDKGCKMARANYFKNLKKILNSNETAPKKKFQLLKNVTNCGKGAGIPPLLVENDVISNPREKADIFNNQFAKKASIEGSDDPVPEIPEVGDDIFELSIIHTDYLELGPIIKNLKCASYSPCGLPSSYIKALFNTLGAYFTKPLARLLNSIFRAKIYPEIF